MKECPCGNPIPLKKKIEGKVRNLKNRSKCLTCMPFNSHLTRRKGTLEARTAQGAKSQEKYEAYKEAHGIDPIKVIRDRRKHMLISLMGGSCFLCGYSGSRKALSLHHIRDKAFEVNSRALQFSWARVKDEIRKCVLVCLNCHAEIHDNMIPGELVNSAWEKTAITLDNSEDLW